VNTFPGLVHTARHTAKANSTRSRYSNRLEEAAHSGVRDHGEVVTRYSYWKVRVDHLLPFIGIAHGNITREALLCLQKQRNWTAKSLRLERVAVQMLHKASILQTTRIFIPLFLGKEGKCRWRTERPLGAISSAG
jgi:hypothetical protein